MFGAVFINVLTLYVAVPPNYTLINGIVGFILVFNWHRANLSHSLDLKTMPRPLGNVLGLVVRTVFLSVIGLAVAIIPLVILSTTNVWGLLTAFASQAIPVSSWDNFGLALAVLIFVVSSVVIARWGLMIPAASVGDRLTYGRAYTLSGSIAPTVTATLWILWIILMLFQTCIEIIGVQLQAASSTPGIALSIVETNWQLALLYGVPTEIFYAFYVLLSVGVVSAAFERTRVPEIYAELAGEPSDTPKTKTPSG